ncbi:MAG: putative toxin-antitoxin system toxin component, PIN family [Ferruginibacter sp.]|jgi:putative PIN family toxin of toxin-antitoxin system
MPQRIVIDTNIWISYFISARADYLIKWVLNNDITIFSSDNLYAELYEVLQRPKFKLPYPAADFVNLCRSVCQQVKPTAAFKEAPDPDDNFLFDLCLKSKAEYLVTADKKLLNYKPPFDLQIITFNQIRSLLQ